MCAQSALSDLLYRSSLSKHSVILVQICLNCKGFFFTVQVSKLVWGCL